MRPPWDLLQMLLLCAAIVYLENPRMSFGCLKIIMKIVWSCRGYDIYWPRSCRTNIFYNRTNILLATNNMIKYSNPGTHILCWSPAPQISMFQRAEHAEVMARGVDFFRPLGCDRQGLNISSIYGTARLHGYRLRCLRYSWIVLIRWCLLDNILVW